MSKETNTEFKIGVFVLLALIGLGVFIFSVTDSSVFEKGKSIKVIFNFANGLKKSAPVRIAGVDQGVVKEINLFFDSQDSKTKAEVELWVTKDIKMPKDSVITINQLGLLGEKYVEIIPGIDTKEFFVEGQRIIGKDPISQEEISSRVLEVADKLDHTISGFNKVLHDGDNIDALESTLTNLHKITGDINEIFSKLRDGKGTMGKLLQDEGLYDELKELTSSLKDVFYNVKEGKGVIGKLLYDDRLYEDLQGLTSDLRKNPWKILYRPRKKKNED